MNIHNDVYTVAHGDDIVKFPGGWGTVLEPDMEIASFRQAEQCIPGIPVIYIDGYMTI